MLRDSPDEEWKCFDVYKEQYPTLEELESFDAVVITGSKCSPVSMASCLALKLMSMSLQQCHPSCAVLVTASCTSSAGQMLGATNRGWSGPDSWSGTSTPGSNA